MEENMNTKLDLINQFEEHLKEKMLCDATIFKVDEQLYGCVYQNEIFLLRGSSEENFVLDDEYKTLEDYFVDKIDPNSKTISELLNGNPVTSLIKDYIDSCDRLRVCHACGKIMVQGYCFEEAAECYCNTLCLRKEFTPDECLQYIEDELLYWTEWY